VDPDRARAGHRARPRAVGDDYERGEHGDDDHCHDHLVRRHRRGDELIGHRQHSELVAVGLELADLVVVLLVVAKQQQRHHEVVMSALAAPVAEYAETFACFGSECTVIVSDAAAVAAARRRLLEWHQQFSRFIPDSELSRLNHDPRAVVQVSPMLRRVVEVGIRVARRSDGLVDPTLLNEIERAGYDSDLEEAGLSLALALELAPVRVPAGPSAAASWSKIEVDRRAGTVARPPGLKFDSGGIAKGVFADELGALLSGHDAFVIDCAGDIRLGGRAGVAREVHIAGPFDESVVHTFMLTSAGVTTSGIGRRSWIGIDGGPAHHLLNPATGRPAFTGVVQATALAPTAAEAEMRSKAAVLSGPDGADGWLIHGGVVVYDDGSHRVLEPDAPTL
jgi:FAD:protein FMN transferase